MGYYVNITDANFGIPKENWDEAFKAVCKLNEQDDLKTGGGGGKKWFAWMPEDYPEAALSVFVECKLPHPLVSVFQMLGFDWELALDGSEFLLTYYDNKTGAEDDFLGAVAPFVRPGSYIDWRGEEGELWRQEFDGNEMTFKRGHVVYEYES